MNDTTSFDISICSPGTKELAEKWLQDERDFIEREAQFGSPVMKKIAGLILSFAERNKSEAQ